MLVNVDELDDFFLSYLPLSGFTGETRENRLKRMEDLLAALGNPEKCYKTIHIAGSKGKGTTATIISRAINTKYRCGLYRSPHVYDLRERFTLSGAFFSDSEYIDAANELESVINTLDFSPTTFELYTAFAYILFRNAKCSYAVIETGLGGRKDATNTIDSVLEILLPIELEHTDILGDTIEKIAIEKSKIIKRESIVIASNVRSEAYRIFKAEADEKGCPFFSFKDDISLFFHKEEKKESISSFSIDGKRYEIHSLLRGKAVGENIAISILALIKLELMTESALKAIENTKIEGRFEERKEGGKSIILDVAHTKESIRQLLTTFTSLYDPSKSTVIYSSVEKKDYKAMIDLLLSKFESIIITKAGSFKKSFPEELYLYAMEKKRKEQKVYLINDEKEALSFSLTLSDIILITGSFYLVGNFGEKNA